MNVETITSGRSSSRRSASSSRSFTSRPRSAKTPARHARSSSIPWPGRCTTSPSRWPRRPTPHDRHHIERLGQRLRAGASALRLVHARLFQALRERMVPDAQRDARARPMGGIRRISAHRLGATSGQDMVVHEAHLLRAWISGLRRSPCRSAGYPIDVPAYAHCKVTLIAAHPHRALS
jgi:hypothetical protein